jgi:phosphonoacetaldehyde hydrolase
VGLSQQELDNLPAEQQDCLVNAARQRLESAHPHYVISGVADLMPIIDEISSRIDRGEKP